MQAQTHIHRPIRRLTTACLLGLLAWGCVDVAVASAGGAAGSAHGIVDGGESTLREGISLDEAIDRAQKRFKARVVRAEQSQSGGRVVYVLRLLSDDDGRVFTVRVDAQSGAMQ